MAYATSHPAGFWIRFVAFVIDVLVVFVAQVLLSLIASRRTATMQGAVAFFTVLFAVLYPAVLHALAGQTIGKLVVGVRVVATDGDLLPGGAALLRAVVHWGSLVVMLGLGHVLAGLRKDKRALHDLLAGSRVERLALPRRRARPTTEPAAAPAAAPPSVGSRPVA
jgi:uncharacterized RDD family membrane protein YckC